MAGRVSLLLLATFAGLADAASSPLIVQWMWGDTLAGSASNLNPWRWSKSMSGEDAIQDLQRQLGSPYAARKVKIYKSFAPIGVKIFRNVGNAMDWLQIVAPSTVVKWMWADTLLGSISRLNLVRWSKSMSVEDTMKNLQSQADSKNATNRRVRMSISLPVEKGKAFQNVEEAIEWLRVQSLNPFNVQVVSLSKEEAANLKQHLSLVPTRGFQLHPSAVQGLGVTCPRMLKTFEELSLKALLNANISKLLDVPSGDLKRSGVVLIRGIDYGPIAPTTEARAMHGSAVPEALLAGMAKLLGSEIVGYEDQLLLNSHLLFHDIRAQKAGKEGANGKGGLGFHFDIGFRPDIRPNFQFLAGLREGIDLDVQTPLLSSFEFSRDLLRRYPEDEDVLRDANAWYISAPETAGSYRVNTPLLSGSIENPTIHLRLDRHLPVTDDARKALSHIDEVLHDNEIGVHLQSGDLLVINNHRVLHRRSSFQASFDERDRLLMRAYAKEAQSVPSKRIFPTMSGHLKEPIHEFCIDESREVPCTSSCCACSDQRY